MTGMVGRFGRIFLRYGCKTLLLLLAVSVIAFILVSLSPVDPVQQYVLGAGGVSAEQRAQLEEYWGVNDPPVERYITWLKALVRAGNSPTGIDTLRRKSTEFSQEGPLLFRREPVPVDPLEPDHGLRHGQQPVEGRDVAIYTVAEPVHIEDFFGGVPLVAVVA